MEQNSDLQTSWAEANAAADYLEDDEEVDTSQFEDGYQIQGRYMKTCNKIQWNNRFINL